METRRRLAWKLLSQGRKIGEVAKVVGVSRCSVGRWKRAVRKGGLKALKAKPHPGRKPQLDGKQNRQLLKILLAGPLKAGYRTDLWTCPRVAEVIAKQFHVKYHPAHVWTMLRGFGWTAQTPEQRAREQPHADRPDRREQCPR